MDVFVSEQYSAIFHKQISLEAEGVSLAVHFGDFTRFAYQKELCSMSRSHIDFSMKSELIKLLSSFRLD